MPGCIYMSPSVFTFRIYLMVILDDAEDPRCAGGRWWPSVRRIDFVPCNLRLEIFVALPYFFFIWPAIWIVIFLLSVFLLIEFASTTSKRKGKCIWKPSLEKLKEGNRSNFIITTTYPSLHTYEYRQQVQMRGIDRSTTLQYRLPRRRSRCLR